MYTMQGLLRKLTNFFMLWNEVYFVMDGLISFVVRESEQAVHVTW